MLNDKDLELIGRAKDVISKNFDDIDGNHSVGCAVRSFDGEIYTGIDMKCLTSYTCASISAVSLAEANGVREYDSIVCVKFDGENYEVVAPCGGCRQMLYRYAKNIEIIVNHSEKKRIEELLVFPGE